MKIKNLFLLIAIYLITILVVIYFCLIYNNSSNNIVESDIGDLIIDVTGKGYDDLYNNIKNYSNENHRYVIYVSSYEHTDIKSFESVFKNVIKYNNFKNRILYINSDELKHFSYINRLLNDFSYEYVLNEKQLPIFISFNGEKITEVISIFDFSYDDLLKYLEANYD